MNYWDPLFVNEAGSEPWRPKTVTEIPNFFVAGDFCDNEIGIVSVEGAVVSGLRAARAVQAQLRADQLDISLDDKRLMEIPIRLPETYPLVNADALKLLLTPQAALGKAWSVAAEMIAHPERVLSPVQMAARLEEALMAPGAVTADWGKYAIDAFRWLADAPYSDD
jgi:hypothetical protein